MGAIMEIRLRVAGVVFVLGRRGVILNRRSILVVLRSVELRLLAVNLRRVTHTVALDDLKGEVFGLLVLTVAAAESAIGLAILVVYFRVRGTIARGYARRRRG